MTSQNPIPDDDFIEKWLDNPMTQEKKEELAKYREVGIIEVLEEMK